MKFLSTEIPDVYLIKPDLHTDSRGYFFRTFCHEEFRKAGISFIPVQTNESLTKKRGTIRGMHYQNYPHEEKKIVRCTKGKIFDVVVDLRKRSPTYLKWVSFTLSEQNHHMLFMPKGCAHGFQTLLPMCVIEYFMSQPYVTDDSLGIVWNDPTVNIRWPMCPPSFLSKRDTSLPFLLP